MQQRCDTQACRSAASCQFALRKPVQFRESVLKRVSAAALSPVSAAPMREEIVDSTRHPPASESPSNAFSVAYLEMATKILVSSNSSVFACAVTALIGT